MSVVVCGGGLFVHAPMRLNEDEQARLDALGPVRWILPPHRMHAREAPWYAERYPEAAVLAPALERERYESKGLRVDGTVEDDWPTELAGVLSAWSSPAGASSKTAARSPGERRSPFSPGPEGAPRLVRRRRAL